MWNFKSHDTAASSAASMVNVVISFVPAIVTIKPSPFLSAAAILSEVPIVCSTPRGCVKSSCTTFKTEALA